MELLAHLVHLAHLGHLAHLAHLFQAQERSKVASQECECVCV